MNLYKTLEDRLKETLTSRGDTVCLEPPADEQPAERSKEGSGSAECQDTEFGQICLQQPTSAQHPAEQHLAKQQPKQQRQLPQPVFEGIKGTEAASRASGQLPTEFGEVKLLPAPAPPAPAQPAPAQPAQSLRSEFGEVKVLDTTKRDASAQAAPVADSPDRKRQEALAAPPNTPANGMASTQQDSNPLRPSISSATQEVRGEAANQKQQGNREYQPVCSSKMFTTIVDQPCEKEIIEVIREHRYYEKNFLVETRPAGERELTDRQKDEELDTRMVRGAVPSPSGPCEGSPQLAVKGN